MVIIVLSSFLCVSPVAVNKKAALITLIILIASTAFFDSLIIAAGLVGYNTELTLNLHIGKAPIEDFAYCLVAAFFAPYFWERMGNK